MLGYYQWASKDNPIKSSFSNRKNITTNHKLVRLLKLGKGAHGYLINIRGAKRLLDQLSIIKKPIDLYTGSDEYITLYAVSPHVIRRHDVLTKQSNLEEERQQIYNSYHPGHYDKKRLDHRLKRELLRPFKQLLNHIIIFPKQLKKPEKYT